MEPDMLLPRGAVGWAIGRWNCTALYTTTECTDYPSYNWLPSRALLVAGSAALLYFLFEGGPCHWTRLAETYYLIVCLTICSLALILALNRNLDGRAQVAFDITRLLALLVAMRIYVSAVSLTNLKPFYAVGDQRPFAAGQMTISDDNSLMAHRVVQQLETHLTHLIIQRETGILHPKVFPVVLLPLLFLQQECISYFGIAWALYWPVKATWIILVAFWMIVEIPRITRRLHTLAEVKQLLTHLLQHGDRELIHEVYRRANLASLFQATTFEVHELLVEDALNRGLLDPFSKAMLINGMQKYGVNNRRLDYVRDLIKSCKNYDLTVLKSILDSTGDYNSLHKLVYNDIRCKRTREEVLYHIAQEASATRSGWGPVGLKVVSDIDDTLLCSGARFPAGCDSRIPRHMVYPGCLQLFKELDRSWNADEPSSNLVFLSARPHVYKDLSESKSFRKFQELFATGKLHCVPTLLPGSLALGIEAVIKALFLAAHGWKEVGRGKKKTFEMYKALYGEYDFIFFGDNGQGDLLAGQLMQETDESSEGPSEEASVTSSEEASASTSWRCCCRRAAPPSKWVWKRGEGPRLKAVMIHEVLHDEDCLSLDPRPHPPHWRSQLADQGVHLFTSYASAALKLHRDGLITLGQLRSVTEAATLDFDQARLFFPEWREQWGSMEAVLSRDIKGNCGMLRAEGEPPSAVFKSCRDFFVQNALRLSRRQSVLLGTCRELSSSLSDGNEVDDADDDSDEDEDFGEDGVREMARAATVAVMMQLPQPRIMTRIGSAWKELQALGSNDAL